MKQENELRARIFAAYWGCEVTPNSWGEKNFILYNIQPGYANGIVTPLFPISKCQLCLTPLSEITEQHALMLPRWIGGIIDTLRGLGYDCGFMDIESLITAGYAVKKEKV